jgi:hypothetical protein
LAESKSEQEVWERFQNLDFDDLLDAMGPSGWESLSEAYLILTQTFVPTGLLVGKTLADLDIVGRRFGTGAKIVAQCKKDPGRVHVAQGFVDYVSQARQAGDNTLEAYYFAYGGCELLPEELKLGITVHDRDSIMRWLRDDHVGAKYWKMVRTGK